MNNTREVRGIVTSVDIRRGVCKVLCNDGRALTNVTWRPPFGGLGRSGLSYSPIPRERVVVLISGQDYHILGSERPVVFSRVDNHYIGPLSSNFDYSFYDRYNASMVSSAAESGNSKPKDQIPGDVSITQGGGNLTITNSGSILAKASSFAQIFLSKIDDIVRVVGRNYQQFSEASKKVQESVLGRVYEYHAWYHTRSSSMAQEPEYEEIRGDVAAGESKKGDYDPEPSLPASDDRILKRVITQSGSERFLEESTLDGNISTVSKDTGSNRTEGTFHNSLWKIEVLDGSSNSFTELTAKKATISSTGGGSVTMVFNDDGTCSLVGSASLFVDFPDVTIQSDTSTVNASTSATVNAPTATITSTTSVTVNTPLAQFSGLVTMPSIAIGPAGSPTITGGSSGLNMIGANVSLDSGSDVSFGSTTLKTHLHPGDGGAGSGPNTGAPIGAS